MTGERKQPRQMTLLSFFHQPIKKRSKQKEAKKTEEPSSMIYEGNPNTDEKANDDLTFFGTVSPPLNEPIDTPKRSIVSPDNSGGGADSIVNRSGTRKRPRSNIASTNSNGKPEESASPETRNLGKFSQSNANHVSRKQSHDVNQQQQKQQERVAETQPIHRQDKVAESSSESESEAEAGIEGGLSDYELLRQRNIERNNARLASLGLLTTTQSFQASEQKKKKPRRKTPRRTPKAPPSMPTRRSTRMRRSVLDSPNHHYGVLSKNTTAEESRPLLCEEIEPEETYTVSPLLQYGMRTDVTNAISSVESPTEEEKALGNSSLRPMGPRLVPPKGLKAIYSLDFQPMSSHRTWLVGAGKAGIVALWDCSSSTETEIDPVLTWKAHSGRWIAEARFLQSGMATSSPSRLITAANDGKVCLWDLSTVSTQSGVPRLLSQSDANLHTSGIFVMDVLAMGTNKNSDIKIATGSKDKTIALSVLGESHEFCPLWRSNLHTAKVGGVRLHPSRNSILASASDDNLVCIHDYQCGEKKSGLKLENVHNRPHSVVWDPYHSDLLMTAGLDKEIKIWDIRSTKESLVSLCGHVPENTPRCKRIHHPTFYYPHGQDGSAFVLSGGERSQALSMFHHSNRGKPEDESNRLYSRGMLPVNYGGAGCIAVNSERVAVSGVKDGEVLVLGLYE